MATPGKLIVFEGPDGVGKSTLARETAAVLAGRGRPCELLSFPGREPGTLGWLVYQLHHDPQRVGVESVRQASLQLLQVAAHVDAIGGRILPALRAGSTIVLDRFWWSTWVYGFVGGVARKTLDATIAVEKAEWGDVLPDVAFLVSRDAPLRADEPMDRRPQLVPAYHELALAEEARHLVVRLPNDGTVADAVERALAAVDGVRFRVAAPSRTVAAGKTRSRRPGAPREPLDLFSQARVRADEAPLEPQARQRQIPHAFCRMAPAKPSEVYTTYWKFAAERQAVFFRRIENVRPLTEDMIIARHKFCNAYRASDRVSQYLIRNVVYRHDQSGDEVFFRTILFKLFNKIETWQLFERELGTPRHSDFDLERYAGVLDRALEEGHTIYSGAYIMPSGSGEYEDRRKHRSHLRLLRQMMRDGLPGRIAECRTMRKAFELILSYPMIGDFLAYQYVTDLNYGTLTDFPETQFVVPGPGARDGIRKCFESLGGLSEADVIKRVAESQEKELERLGIDFRTLWGRPLQLIDCQNLFCETDKYARLAHPEVQGISGRTRIKQTYRSHPDPIAFWYPPRWGINDAAEATRRIGEGPAEAHANTNEVREGRGPADAGWKSDEAE
jgi:thymidylate kinase